MTFVRIGVQLASIMNLNLGGLSVKEIQKGVLEAVVELKKQVGIIKRLNEKGVNSSDISDLSANAIKDACMLTNPRKANKRDVEVIFEEAM